MVLPDNWEEEEPNCKESECRDKPRTCSVALDVWCEATQACVCHL